MILEREPFDPDRPPMSGADFASALAHLGLTSHEAARRLGVAPRNVRRWISGYEAVPLNVEGFVKFANTTIALKRFIYEKHGVTVLVGISRHLCLDMLGSIYQELHAVPPPEREEEPDDDDEDEEQQLEDRDRE
jgi:hypothetical protein